MAAAYRAMSPGLQKMLCDLSAWHSDSSFRDSNVGLETNSDAFRDPVLHPVIVKHPVTGTPCVYVNGILQLISKIGVSKRVHLCWSIFIDL
jgi:taurine dioxygenase